jgi:outer membrane protein insertion porin family
VTDVSFSGNDHFSDDQLKEQMTTGSTGFVSRTILRKDPFRFDPDILENDIQTLKEYYQKRGFLSVEIPSPSYETNDEDREVTVHIQIKEGIPVIVNTIQPVFSGMDTSQSEISQIYQQAENDFYLKRGAIFQDADLKQDELLLFEVFGSHGFPYVDVSYLLSINDESDSVHIVWDIVAGPKCSFGEIQITGNKDVSSTFIDKQISIRKGTIFNRKMLDEAQARLFSTGLFQVAIVKAPLADKQQTVIPVKVEVKEAPRWSTRVGIGYGREDRFRAFNQSRKLGVFGGARRMELLLKYSYLEPYNVDLKFIEPIFFSNRTALEINPFIR